MCTNKYILNVCGSFKLSHSSGQKSIYTNIHLIFYLFPPMVTFVLEYLGMLQTWETSLLWCMCHTAPFTACLTLIKMPTLKCTVSGKQALSTKSHRYLTVYTQSQGDKIVHKYIVKNILIWYLSGYCWIVFWL